VIVEMFDRAPAQQQIPLLTSQTQKSFLARQSGARGFPAPPWQVRFPQVPLRGGIFVSSQSALYSSSSGRKPHPPGTTCVLVASAKAPRFAKVADKFMPAKGRYDAIRSGVVARPQIGNLPILITSRHITTSPSLSTDTWWTIRQNQWSRRFARYACGIALARLALCLPSLSFHSAGNLSTFEKKLPTLA